MRKAEFTTGHPQPQRSRSHHADRRTLLRWVQFRGSHTGTRTNLQLRAVASAEEVRILRINPDGKRHHILTEPSWTPETDTFCQMHSDLTGCVVEAARCAAPTSVFQPTNPPERPTDPPISDRVKDVTETAADLAGLTILIAVAWAAFMVL